MSQEDAIRREFGPVALNGPPECNISTPHSNPKSAHSCRGTMTHQTINRPRSWNGKAVTGDWLVTLKLDGVRAIWCGEQGWRSRANKPLFNIPPWQQGQPRDCEVFVKNFTDTIRATRTRNLKGSEPSIDR